MTPEERRILTTLNTANGISHTDPDVCGYLNKMMNTIIVFETPDRADALRQFLLMLQAAVNDGAKRWTLTCLLSLALDFAELHHPNQEHETVQSRRTWRDTIDTPKGKGRRAKA